MFIHQEWLTLPGRRERVFSQGQFDEEMLRHQPIAVVEDSSGRVLAFASLILNYAPHCLAGDLIRRRRQIPNGTMDYLFLNIIEDYRSRGYTRLNLGLAPLAGLDQRGNLTIPEQILKFFYHSIRSLYNTQGLYEFKNKFKPRWEPRYLIYQQPYHLPSIGLALMRAINPQKFGRVGRRRYLTARYDKIAA